uniref:Uncharacterized protein n=1 Tax=Arion vulgaris TaxID=1028688 RepID=A0A0B6YSU7_9EUPU
MRRFTMLGRCGGFQYWADTEVYNVGQTQRFSMLGRHRGFQSVSVDDIGYTHYHFT